MVAVFNTIYKSKKEFSKFNKRIFNPLKECINLTKKYSKPGMSCTFCRSGEIITVN
jgi:5-bromo-4-chloroindolyl phosphate hydrolysis protein